MKQIHRKWTDEEIEYMKNNFEKTNAKTIAKVLNRPINSVRNRGQLLKIKKDIFGKNNSSWKRGYYKENGYIILTGKYECPYSGIKGRIKEHVYIWWINHPNEPILLNEVIHHKNNIRNDNRIENLEKMKRIDHSKLHRIKQLRDRDEQL
jgi:hypothetical protein